MIAPAMTSRQHYLDSHPSLGASMDDFEAREFSPTIPDMPSQHSGFREGYQSNQHSEYSERSSRRSYSPPAWRKAGSGWFQHHQALSPNRRGYNSKDPSPQYHSADEEGDNGDVTAYRTARRIPLPESPVKGRTPSGTPEPAATLAAAAAGDKGGGTSATPTIRGISHDPEPEDDIESPTLRTPTQNNYIRFSTSLDVVQRTEPIEQAVRGVRKAIDHVTKSTYNTFFYALSTLMLYWVVVSLLSTPTNGPSPDLIKVAGLAKSFEPVIYYSEHGHAQIEQLQETGVAVWDLGESVRSTNMTSAPLIVNQLDDLSDSLKTLAQELTRFFAGVDADIDGILIVMEWAQRELATISSEPPSTITSVWSNAHSFLTKTGILSESKLMQDLLGQTYQQRTKSALERTFHEFLGVLEESINNELTYSIQLFSLFEAIDKQFLNLQRTVIREQDQQERMENDFLGSLWTKVIGVNASKLRKYEKNKNLLHSVRDRTVRNKHILVDHNQRLLQLKSNLEILRRKLVSPLVRSANSSTLSVDEQIKGLDTTYQQLKSSRETQKRKMMEIVYGAGHRRVTLPGDANDDRSIDGGHVTSAYS
ncbi:uncharacterized protein CLAFUR5_06009 [Fulvia fulva]|uniref:Uncharacterized protein n=1 Tax=Passalora fulva TaxID=5499 RepID=A0A9Q8LIN6_PASFU|nr:uncharacterized protein CLAFUR5_06009 [Fulvia fulva]KAK4624820.1 hypothetical protein CLAFUR0_05872 [Fulvia fulva]UJO18116.1 hypothetical protein CLAFUR5_06009 [Fulvia fulva]